MAKRLVGSCTSAIGLASVPLLNVITELMRGWIEGNLEIYKVRLFWQYFTNSNTSVA